MSQFLYIYWSCKFTECNYVKLYVEQDFEELKIFINKYYNYPESKMTQ